MNYVVGAIKFIGAIIFSLSIIIVSYMYLEKSTTDKIIAIVVLLVFGGFYIYYLIRTAIWNVRNLQYKTDVLFWAGLAIQVLSLICGLYLGITSDRSFLLTTMMILIFGIMVCIYDLTIAFRRLSVKT
jgi:hypothetical protein